MGPLLVLLGVFSACDRRAPSTLDPHGPGAARISVLWWVMFGLAVTLILFVTILLFYGVLRKRKGERDLEADEKKGTRLIIIGGVIVPVIILAALFVVMLNDLQAESREVAGAKLSIDVVAHQWWWEVRYDGGAVVSANEIHIPVGETVLMNITSDDVIHSFWVPQLQAKVDMIPGTTNQVPLQADQPGEYRGICGEFCGLQHAKMQFIVIAEDRPAFDSWLANESRPAQSGTPGAEAFLSSTCSGCHTLRGVAEDSSFGPDLTHFGGRKTIGAGAIPNTRGNLAGWILDAQDVKPGSKMPPQPVTPDQLDSLLTYLESLR
jgi:cytochrome c oxidase subunit 2